jgi:hypothetical protein
VAPDSFQSMKSIISSEIQELINGDATDEEEMNF